MSEITSLHPLTILISLTESALHATEVQGAGCRVGPTCITSTKLDDSLEEGPIHTRKTKVLPKLSAGI